MAAEAFLAVRELSKSYARPRRERGEEPGRGISGVSFTLERGRALALVGASGSGKSTLARCLAGFETADSGAARLNGLDLLHAARRERAAVLQMVFQQPAATLNPRFTAEEIVSEPLLIARRGSPVWRATRAAELLEMAGLPAGAGRKRAMEFSGGERQRLALARALALEPQLLILDESLSGLDLSLQAQMVRLLQKMRARLGLTLLVISHDLDLASRMADELAVMEAGRIVEIGEVGGVLAAPRHPRTRALVEAARAFSPEGSL